MFQDPLIKKIAEAAAQIKTEPKKVEVNEKSVEGAVSKIMNEKLVGDQHKIDANKNNKIDAHDFKLLRTKKKMKEETEEIDEASDGRSATKSEYQKSLKTLEKMPEFEAMSKSLKRRDQDAEYDKRKSDEFKKSLKKEETELTESHFKVGDEVVCKKSGMEGEVVKVDEPQVGKYYTVKQENGKMVKYAPNELKKEEEDDEDEDEEDEDKKEMKESTEQLDEVGDTPAGKKMLGKYITKRAKQLPQIEVGYQMSEPRMAKRYEKYKKKVNKGIGRAVDRLTKEENEELDEAWPGTPEYKAKYGTDKEKHEAKYGKSGDSIEKYGYRGKEPEHGETDWSKENKKKGAPKKKYGARQNFIRSRRISGKELKDSFTGLLDVYRDGGLKSLKEMFMKEEPDNEQFTKEVEEVKKKATEKKSPEDEARVAKAKVDAVKVEEDVEQLDEIGDTPAGKKMLASYAKKASRDARMKYATGKDFERHARTSRKPEYKAGAKEWEDKYKSDARRREAGVNKAIDRLAKEEVEELDEAMTRKHFQQVADVIKSHPDQEKRNELAKHHAGIFKTSNPRFDHNRFYQAAGANIKEEVEQIDELDQKTLSKYTTRAKFSSDPKHREGAAKAQEKLQNKKDMKKEEVEQIDEVKTSTLIRYGTKATQSTNKLNDDPAKREKREAGIERSIQKVKQRYAKEEVELDERSLTEPEMKKKEEVVKSMKKGMQGFKDRYGDRAKEVMYGTATKIAKEKA